MVERERAADGEQVMTGLLHKGRVGEMVAADGVDQQSEDQVGEQPVPGERVAFRRQPVEAEQPRRRLKRVPAASPDCGT